MAKTKPPVAKPAPHPPGHDPDRDEHGHFIKNRMHDGPPLRWFYALALAAAIIGIPMGIAALMP
jgi:hypothetical protein